MIDNDPDVLKSIEEMAAQLTPPTEMAVILNINEDSLMLALSRHGSPARQAFLRGRAKTAAKIRQKNIDLANAGSPDAIRSCVQALKAMVNELD